MSLKRRHSLCLDHSNHIMRCLCTQRTIEVLTKATWIFKSIDFHDGWWLTGPVTLFTNMITKSIGITKFPKIIMVKQLCRRTQSKNYKNIQSQRENNNSLRKYFFQSMFFFGKNQITETAQFTVNVLLLITKCMVKQLYL